MRLLTRFPSGYVQFIILAPLIMKGSGGEAMSSDQVQKAFVGNTVVLQQSAGTGYDYVKPDGTHVGMHPGHAGTVLGTWKFDGNEVCVTWKYSTGAITNCGTVTDLGDGKYQWGDQTLTVQSGDVKGLAK